MFQKMSLNSTERNAESGETAPFDCGKRHKVHMEDGNGTHTLHFNKMEPDYKDIEKRFGEVLRPTDEDWSFFFIVNIALIEQYSIVHVFIAFYCKVFWLLCANERH